MTQDQLEHINVQLGKERKQAMGLLSIGTFLEYFDLMLYIHMAVLLNEIFFPKSDPFTSSLISAFAFCSSYVLRPLGGLIFGWIGDNIGRRETVIITTSIMAVSCIVMACVPTYAQIGITASWIVTICRMVQGMSSLGELVGAEIYLTEITTPPTQYFTVASLRIFCSLGAVFALGIATLATSFGFNWRFAFLIGTLIALVGSVARTGLKETREFADAKRRMKRAVEKEEIDIKLLDSNPILHEKVNIKTSIYYFLMECAWPVWFYLTYIYCSNLLKHNFNYTSSELIHQNLLISLIQLSGTAFFAILCCKLHPLKIAKIKLAIFTPFILICPFILGSVNSPIWVFITQSFCVFFSVSGFPAYPIFYRCFPVFKRFTYTSIIYAFSRSITHIITSFGMVFITKFLGHLGLLIIIVPVLIFVAGGLYYFEKLDLKSQKYYKNMAP